jgi:hypothetical protein
MQVACQPESARFRYIVIKKHDKKRQPALHDDNFCQVELQSLSLCAPKKEKGAKAPLFCCG